MSDKGFYGDYKAPDAREFIVNVVTEARSINNRQANANTVFLEF